MTSLRVSLVQAETVWHDAAANRELYGRLIAPLAGKSDLVVLPETFTSGFSNDAVNDAEDMQGPSVAWMREQARGLGAVITGSVVIGEAGAVFNRLIWAKPDGGLQHYDKRHLFRMAGEHQRYAPGRARPIFQLGEWRILPQVCYDLRFPVFSRNRVNVKQGAAFPLPPLPLAGEGRGEGNGHGTGPFHDPGRQGAMSVSGSEGELEYDLMIFVANWPAPRRQHWRTLLRARAIENLAWCIGVNRAGTDGNGIAYAGDSAVIDFLGEPLVELGPAAQVATTTLSRDALLAHRERFPAHSDADGFELSEVAQR